MRTIQTIAEMATDRLIQCGKEIAEHYLPAIHLIYCSVNGRPQAFGTCHLIELDIGKFILTAAHVADKLQTHRLYMAVEEKLVEITCQFICTIAPGGNRFDDHFDFAFAKIDESLETAMGNVRYFDQASISHNRGKLRHSYIAIGYPASRNKVNPTTKSLHRRAWTYSGVNAEMPKLAGKLGISSETHIFFKHENYSRSVDGKKVRSVLPHGSSGGVVIDLGPADPENLRPDARCRGFLSGLLIEKHKDEKAMIAVKIGVVIEQMRKHF